MIRAGLSALRKLFGAPAATGAPDQPVQSPATNDFTAQTLYHWLDGHGVPFRTPVGDLIRTHGTKPSDWLDNMDVLALPYDSAPLPQIVGPPQLNLGRGTSHDLPPQRFTFYIRAHDDPAANVAIAEAALSARFGPATSRRRTNAIELEWSDPANPICQIRVLGFIPTDPLNQQANSRHDRIKGSKTEASITITTDYWPDLTLTERAALSDLRPVLPPKEQARTASASFGIAGYGFDRPVPSDLTLSPGLWTGGDPAQFALVSAAGRYVTFSQDDIEDVRFDQMIPAKGAGGSSISVSVRRFGLSRRLAIVSDAYGAPDLPALADQIAARLERPLKTSESYDC